MAAKCRAVPTAMVAVVAILMAVAVSGDVGREPSHAPSSLTAWSGPGCSGDVETIEACGCFDLEYYAGQEFNYRGETATLYTGTGCSGTPYNLFEDTQACADFGWRSINIDC